jgi:hypothetical protein
VFWAGSSGSTRRARRVTTGLAVATVVLACLAACGGEGSDSSADDPAAPDFAATLNGPDTAENGTVKPRHLTIEPGASAKVDLEVEQTPLTIEVESVGAGPGLDEFTIN